MPRLTLKDAELVIGLLRQSACRPHDASSPEGRLLRRLEQRVASPSAALSNWKRRGHTELVQRLGADGGAKRTSDTRSGACRNGAQGGKQ